MREARSFVFNVNREEMVLTPFRKFFNLNEVEENSVENIIKEIDRCQNFEISEKLDGSVQAYRHYDGKIVGSGSMAIDINNSYRLQEGFELLTDNHKKMIMKFPNITFIFEYLSDKDVHIVPYDYSNMKGLHLIGMRNVDNGYEYTYKTVCLTATAYEVPYTNLFSFNTLDDVTNYVKNMKIEDGEGFVLNIDGHKLKIKSDEYLQLHRLDDKFSSVNVLIKAYADGTIDDLYSSMSELQKTKNKHIMDKIERYVDKTNKDIKLWNSILRNHIDTSEESLNTKSIMKIINEYPSNIREYVRMDFFHRKYSILKTNKERYKKFSEIDIDL